MGFEVKVGKGVVEEKGFLDSYRCGGGGREKLRKSVKK